MKKKIMFLLAFLFCFSIVCGCSDSNSSKISSNNYTPITKENEYDLGTSIIVTGYKKNVTYTLNYSYNKNTCVYFCMWVENKGANNEYMDPSDCEIIDQLGRKYYYNYTKTSELRRGMSSYEPVRPGSQNWFYIAFYLPSNWENENYKFRVNYSYTKSFLYLLNNITIKQSEY